MQAVVVVFIASIFLLAIMLLIVFLRVIIDSVQDGEWFTAIWQFLLLVALVCVTIIKLSE